MVVNIYDGYNVMTTFTGYAFYDLTHFSVAYYCYFHIILQFGCTNVLIYFVNSLP